MVPIIDVETRWNSTYDMLVRAYQQRGALSDTFYRHKDKYLINLDLSEKDWACIEQLIEILQPLKEATLLASRNGESMMVTNVIPVYQYATEELEDFLKKFNDEAEENGTEVQDISIGLEAAIVKLNHYYDMVSPMIGIALILDPTMKEKHLRESLGWEIGWVDSVMMNFYSSFNFYREKATHLAPPPQPTAEVETSRFAGFEKHQRKKRVRVDGPGAVEEYISYFNEPIAPAGTNILEFWKVSQFKLNANSFCKAKQFQYPILAAMAKDYLTVQASSVSAERAFSSGTDLVTADRCRLTGKTIEMTQFLKFVL